MLRAVVGQQLVRCADGRGRRAAHEILIVDYKTNRPPPSDTGVVPLAYRRQLALYRALLQRIYPGRKVRAFLLWTATPQLMEIDGKSLDNSMPYASPS